MTSNENDDAVPAGAPNPEVRPSAPAWQISGFWRRLAALVLDTVILGTAGLILGATFWDKFAAMGAAGRLVGFTVSLAYFGVMNSAVGHGQTLGKRALGIQVVDRAGQLVTLGRSFVRTIVLTTPLYLNGLFLPPTTTFLFIGSMIAFAIMVAAGATLYLVAFNRRNRQGLHDLAVGSYVVRAGGSGAIIARGTWMGHFAIIGTCAVVTVLAAQILARNLLRRSDLQELQRLATKVYDDAEVRSASVFLGRFSNHHNGVSTTTRRLTINVVWRQRPDDYQRIGAKIAAIVFENYPDAVNNDAIDVVVRYGYDIGIANGWRSEVVAHSPSEWKRLLRR